MKKIIFTICIILCCTGFDWGGPTKEMYDKTLPIAVAIEETTGVRPSIGWKVFNGKVSQISVNFLKNPDPKITRNEIYNIAKKDVFGDKNIPISINFLSLD